ncbi:hypothetical protein [Iodobacter fluviatilis]|uniref:Aspartyl protease n=1 Tax=Iodobacter fluviatilis TaxID=537 RepID=A0A377STH6_9NEIS|nr:hypothetical protein [Iodobacter fluviatilis]TCU84995.1 hypothetical protein EV682_10818 [Iodobacter fluviatilis]STR45321.1 Uncharacterised protein [Iodobacter fluviatilis]
MMFLTSLRAIVVAVVLITPSVFGAEPALLARTPYLSAPANFTLPFYLFNGHILIDGVVNGREGKLMFDTGTEFPFFLNNHYLPLGKDKKIGEGQTASGQKMVLYQQHQPINKIDLAGQMQLKNVPAVLHTDWRFIEQAYTPYFLGSIGHGFNRNYLFVIDYEAQTLAFHAFNQDKALLASVVDPARVVATFEFTPTGVDGKMPEVVLHIGDHNIKASFDTGNIGSLQLTEAMKNALLTSGELKLQLREFTYGLREPHMSANLQGLYEGSTALAGACNLTFKIGKTNQIGLGYHFLKNYISVWDYQNSRLTLLKP